MKPVMSVRLSDGLNHWNENRDTTACGNTFHRDYSQGIKHSTLDQITCLKCKKLILKHPRAGLLEVK